MQENCFNCRFAARANRPAMMQSPAKPVNSISTPLRSTDGRSRTTARTSGVGRDPGITNVAGRTRPDGEGEVRYRGHAIEPGAVHRNVQLGIGMVPQTRNVFPNLTVKECLEIAATRSGEG